MFCQLFITAILVFLFQKQGTLAWTTKYNFENMKKCLPVSLVFCVNTVIALKALDGMNIPMYNAMRRCGPIVCLMLSPCFIRQETNRNIYISIFMITFGTFLAASGDLNFDIKAYTFGVISVFSAALYFLIVQKLGVDKDFDALSMMYINSVTCLPVMLVMAFLTSEVHDCFNTFEDLFNIQFHLSFLFVILFACVFSYSIFLSTTANSALSTILVGVIKSALTTIIGMYTFGGVVPTVNFVLGQFLNLSGGALYAFEKYKLRTAAVARKEYILNSEEHEVLKDASQQA